MTFPEKSTNQLAVWRDLIGALDQLATVWERTHTVGPHSTDTTQLPANMAGALAKTLACGTDTVAGAAQVLAAQHDSGTRFRTAADALRAAADHWLRP
jgi:hypothetical protein